MIAEHTNSWKRISTSPIRPKTSIILYVAGTLTHRVVRRLLTTAAKTNLPWILNGIYIKEHTGITRKAKQVSQIVVLMTDCYSNLTKTITNTNRTAISVACFFLEPWLVYYGKPSKLLTDNGFQLVRTFFVRVCSCIRVISISTTEDHSESTVQLERFNSPSLRDWVTTFQLSNCFGHVLATVNDCLQCTGSQVHRNVLS